MDSATLASYGKCEACGKPISVKRLEALPSASLCIKCKAAAEAGQLAAPHGEYRDWERVEEYELAANAPVQTALDRGESIS